MDFITILTAFLILGSGIKVGVSFWNMVWKPWFDFKPYSMLEAFVLSGLVIFAYNVGIFESLGIAKEVTLQPMFHYVDLFVTTLIVTGGANGVHKFIKMAKNSLAKEEVK